MKWSLSSILRTFMWMAVGLTVLAIGLGRNSPRAIPTYQAAAVRYHGVNMHCSAEQDPQPCFLDRETGQILQLAFSPQDSLDYAICSPWRDERGQFQAVARWMKRAGSDSDYLPQDFGIARFTVPEGRLIDRVKLDHVPIGDPCWVPGETPRIVYASGDGGLYGHEFEGTNRHPFEEAQESAKAQPLVWRATPPGTGLLYIRDLIWPEEAKLGGRLLASISYRVVDNGIPRMSRPQLWWLQLSDDATAIEAIGRLTVPDADDNQGAEGVSEQRLPYVVATADKELALAYLSRNGSQSLWELRVASITIDSATGYPTTSHKRSLCVGEGFLPSTPAFSADGQWVYGIRSHDRISSQLMARRFSVTDVLAQADGASRRPDLVRAEPALLDSGTVVPRAPGHSRAESTPLLSWANLAIFDPNWLVKIGAGRHAGE